ncbi:MAG: DUF1829 domain-containing protein [Planctomycetia bacterium]|nr:DUF1829 domain-containing protein [Planctomycetia bacterium]
MSTADCSILVAAYSDWLKEHTSVQNLDGICEITTPFLDRHNDHLQLYVQRSRNGFLLSDDGYTIRDLRMSGCELVSAKRKESLHQILNGFGVRLVDDELQTEAQFASFPQKKHNLLQAMMAVGDLFVLANPTVKSLFYEDVEQFLRANDVRYTPSVKFTGKSQFDHRFDFVIPASRKSPERIIRALNHPDKDHVSSLIFSWEDIRAVRAPDARAIALLNDVDYSVNPEVTGALNQYEIRPVLWSQREQHVGELAA